MENQNGHYDNILGLYKGYIGIWDNGKMETIHIGLLFARLIYVKKSLGLLYLMFHMHLMQQSFMTSSRLLTGQAEMKSYYCRCYKTSLTFVGRRARLP